MNRILLTTILILFLVAVAKAQTAVETKTVKDQYGNVEQYSFYRDANGTEIKHGKYVQYLANGTKVLEMIYQNGKGDGLQTHYFAENGRKQVEGYRRNDTITGVWTRWHLNGKKAEERPYENNSLNGVCKYWSESGKFVEEVKYINGKPAAFVVWEKRNAKTAFLYADIIVRLDKLEFVSKYANVRKEFQLSELEGLIDSLPKAVWDGGKIVAIQGTGQKNQADYKRTVSLAFGACALLFKMFWSI
ncbi:MAG TPA: hypothetical protein VMM84_12485 [Pyrinomonadaceae bacterium]|nr:hypothetical protein [Pyrinomonadaceae bacterium]